MPNYSDLLNIDDSFEKKVSFSDERGDVTFYCKDCEDIVNATREDPKWYVFKCEKCSWSNISIWTKEWIMQNYRIK